MTHARYLSLIITSFFATSAIADTVYTAKGAFSLDSQEGKQLVQVTQAAQSVNTPQNVQIFSENAVGQQQKTIVDQNGNLKVVEKLVETPAQTTPSTSDTSPSPIPQNESPENPNSGYPTLEQQQQQQQQQVPPPSQMQPGQMQSGQPQPSQMQPSQMQPSQTQPAQSEPAPSQPVQPQGGQPR